MPDRVIFHADCNNFFASCECLDKPELKDVPMAVAGDPEDRSGIVVAKNELAKACGVKTTDTVFAARRKCPDIVFVPPRHRFYQEISGRVNQIYLSYTDYVEPASIDESYLDMTGAPEYFHVTAVALADELRARVREEIGITISVGVSYCKIFAKMGSDYKKPDATTSITRENYRELLWPLPVSDLLFAGKSAARTLEKKGILTIGDLARQPERAVSDLMGKHGRMLWRYANGIDEEPVRKFTDETEIKSVSRGRTFKRDLVRQAEVETGVNVLVDEIARTLRRQRIKGSVVSVQIRRPDMSVIVRQMKLNRHTFLQHELRDAALRIIRENWNVSEKQPIRSITVSVTRLIPAEEAVEQVSLFDGDLDDSRHKREKQEALEAAVEKLRERLGEGSITLGYPVNEEIGIRKRGD